MKVNWGIIGCGNVCEVKSGPAFYKIPYSNLIAVMRRNEYELISYAKRHNISRYFTSADELISQPDINAIYIATPPYSHKYYTIKALKAGKSVYVEKPMAINTLECAEMNRCANDTWQKLFVAYYRRALPYFIKVKELIPELGLILNVHVKHFKTITNKDKQNDNWRLNKNISGGGYFYDLAPHTLDILDFLLGEIEDAKGYTTNSKGFYDLEDGVVASFRFKSGVIGTGEWCFVAPEQEVTDLIEITGTRAKLIFNTFTFEPIRLIKESDEKQYTILPPQHIQQPLIETIVNELRGIGSCPSNGLSGERTSRVIDMIYGLI